MYPVERSATTNCTGNFYGYTTFSFLNQKNNNKGTPSDFAVPENNLNCCRALAEGKGSTSLCPVSGASFPSHQGLPFPGQWHLIMAGRQYLQHGQHHDKKNELLRKSKQCYMIQTLIEYARSSAFNSKMNELPSNI